MQCPVEKTPEAQLLERYQSGEEEALDELVVAYQDQAFWVARHTVGNDDVAYDLVQDAFVRVLRRPGLYDPQRPFKAWFLQIVRNLAIDHLRRRRAQASELLADTLSVEGGRGFEQRELGEQIQAVLQALPEKYRELIILRDVEGYGPEEIAQMMDADHGTTRWRIHQARKKFREIWVARYGDR